MNAQVTPATDIRVDEQKRCKNCGAGLTDAYCGRCGQPAKTARLTLKSIYREFILHFIGADRGFIHTIRQLTFRPGHMIREYVQGKRQPYIKPFQYFLIFLTLNFLLMELLDVNLAATAVKENSKPMSREVALSMEFFTGYFNNLKLFTFLIIPFYALILLVLYRRSGYNFVELVIVNLYQNGQAIFYFILTLPLAKISMSVYGILSLVISLAVQVWMYAQFFGGSNKWLATGKAILATFLTSIVFNLLAVSVGALVYVLVKLSQGG